METLVAETQRQLGKLDILVNTAGMVLKKPLAGFTEEEYDRLFDINAKAAFFCMREAARHMENEGRVVNIVTTLVGATTGFYSGYAGSKAPLEDFTRALAKEAGSRGITVNAVGPGPLDTSFFYPAETPESIAWLKQQSYNGELGKIEDIVPLIQFLVSPAARWITAQTIFINGGFLAR